MGLPYCMFFVPFLYKSVLSEIHLSFKNILKNPISNFTLYYKLCHKVTAESSRSLDVASVRAYVEFWNLASKSFP